MFISRTKLATKNDVMCLYKTCTYFYFTHKHQTPCRHHNSKYDYNVVFSIVYGTNVAVEILCVFNIRQIAILHCVPQKTKLEMFHISE